jgi:hypothetical protein
MPLLKAVSYLDRIFTPLPDKNLLGVFKMQERVLVT